MIRYALENEISAIPGNDIPPTAKEYAEKLREYFGKPVSGELDIKDCFCSARNCPGCAFDADPACVAAVVMFDPERALQMIQEVENKDKPKGKTYLEDFREKFPKAGYLATGSPVQCRNNLYFAGAPCSVKPCPNCCDCWNEVMPEEGNEK